METMVQTFGLTKRYGKKVVQNNVSIHIRKGDIYGLIGKNGAGKTTLMKVVLGLTKPTAGKINLFDGKDLKQSRRKIGALLENPALYRNETAFENMKRFSLLAPTSDEEIRRLLNLVGLGNTGRKKTKQFSLGMRQRLAIAIALLGNPDFLILDEPINGLDPSGIKEIRDVILDLNAKGITFLISSHLLDELGKIATQYGILANGRLVEEISKEELAEKCRSFLKIQTDNGQEAAKLLQAFDSKLQITVMDNQLTIANEVDNARINEVLVRGGVGVYALYNESMDLEEFFIERMER